MNKIAAPVDKILDDYIAQITAAYPNLVEGIYLTGSVPLGDYYSKKSDIDFITVVKERLSKEMLEQLRRIHHNIERTHHHPKLNGNYLTKEGIRNDQRSFPSFFRNKMYPDRPFELDRLSLWELKTSSVRVYGVPVEDLQIEVEFQDVIKQLHENINSYWTTWIVKHSPFHLNYVLLVLFPRLTEWGILGVARQLYTLETGKITSKLHAGTYCLSKLPPHLKHVMLTAIETRRTNKTELKPSPGRAKETLDCLKFIIGEFNRVYEGQRLA